MQDLSLESHLFGEHFDLPIALSPVGLTGMYARRGEVQAAKAAEYKGIPFTMSTVSVCPIEEVSSEIHRPMWFQLYVLKDRGFMKNVLERAKAAGVTTLVFTVDMPVPGSRYRDMHSGMSGDYASFRRIWQAMRHPDWAFNVGLFGKPHDLAISQPIAESQPNSRTISAGLATTSTLLSLGKTLNGFAIFGTDL